MSMCIILWSDVGGSAHAAMHANTGSVNYIKLLLIFGASSSSPRSLGTAWQIVAIIPIIPMVL